MKPATIAKSAAAALAVLLVGLPPASAQNADAIKQRQALLKEMGKAAKLPGQMLKQEIPFDLAAVKAALAVFQSNPPKVAALFPDDSKTGAETEALPVIWENKADVEQRFAKLAADAKAAEAAITDEFAFMEEMPKVMGNCGGCHKKYRQQK
ncbi:MAG: cytochrome c [Hyphomicrobiaceae bacterium]